MKITFICGSLEIGRDGVGDYVRRIGLELLQMKIGVTAIALNDYYVTSEVVTDYESDRTQNILVLRIPATWPSNRRFARAKQWIEVHDPEWISLQFVPFSFHFKGLSHSLGRELAKVGKGKRWHLMVHELWTGMNYGASVKHVLLGRLQRYLFKLLVKNIKPQVIHTQCQLYKIRIESLGFKVDHLPLFSNIINTNSIYENSSSSSSYFFDAARNGISLVVFGSIHPGAPVEQLAHDASLYSQEHNCPVSLIMIGRCGNEQNHWAATWIKAGLPTQILGEQPSEVISHLLNNASLGITTTPVALIGKSGTVAAMHEHGLSVLSISRPWRTREFIEVIIPEYVYVYRQGNFAEYIIIKTDKSYKNNISEVAQQLVFSMFNTRDDQ